MHKLVVLLSCATLGWAFAGTSANAQSGPTIFIKAQNDFGTALAAAIVKKHVRVVIVTTPDKAQYTLESAAVDSKAESTGSKFARCMFMDCIGVNGFSDVSVQLVRNKDGAVAWAYQVRKGNSGPLGIQSLSEAVAKHLKNDYLDKQPVWVTPDPTAQ
jgi:hypothetical protein